MKKGRLHAYAGRQASNGRFHSKQRQFGPSCNHLYLSSSLQFPKGLTALLVLLCTLGKEQGSNPACAHSCLQALVSSVSTQ